MLKRHCVRTVSVGGEAMPEGKRSQGRVTESPRTHGEGRADEVGGEGRGGGWPVEGWGQEWGEDKRALYPTEASKPGQRGVGDFDHRPLNEWHEAVRGRCGTRERPILGCLTRSGNRRVSALNQRSEMRHRYGVPGRP